MRCAFKALVGLTATLFSWTACQSRATPPGPPNVVLILVDDQGWTGTSLRMEGGRSDSASDYYSTPALERLAEDGMRFSNAYASSPMCSPSRASIQTGKSPARLHMTDIIEGGDPEHARYARGYVGKRLVPPMPRAGLPESEVTLAELIKERRPEYKTAHFGKWHLGAGGPGQHGYDVHDGDTGNFGGQTGDPDPKETFSLSERACAFMENRSAANEPFFMQVSYYAVHLRIEALEATVAAYEKKPPGTRHRHHAYGAMTEDLDTGVERILDKLDALGIDDNTYVIYTSDNGAIVDRYSDITNNLPLSRGKGSTREGGVRVPLVIRGPAVSQGGQSDVPVIGWDLLPTVGAWLALDGPLPEDLDGGDLTPILTGDSGAAVARPRDELVWHYPHYLPTQEVQPQSAIRLGDYKLVYEYQTERRFLYDLAVDIEEKRNLAESHVERADELRGRLTSYLDSVDAALPERP